MSRRGWRTSEFWVVVITNVALVLSAVTEVLPAKWAAIGAAVTTGLYAVARGLAKQGGTGDS